jgi:Serine/threonine protein kinase
LNGTTLGGRYELIEIVGEGGMSTVFKARDKILDRIVAVKVLKDEFSKDKGFVEKFKTEALSAASISHPNIVNIYDVGQEKDVHYIVMEYVDGTTLKDIIRKRAPLPVNEAVDMAIMICDGVHHAHEKGIIHRDLKPHNILITEQGMVKVADFGIARAVSAGTITYGNNIVGSVHYFSPEQARGEVINRTTDIYSIGCILYEMVTGKVPFDAESPITVALRHIHDAPPSPREKNPDIPAALESIIFRAMEKVPARRFQTAQDMRNALLNVSRAGAIAGQEKDGDKLKKRKLKPAGIALIVIALLGLLSGVMWMMGGNLFGKEVVVPDIVGMNMKDADDALTKLGLVMNVIAQQNDPTVDKDLIISQDPGKGRKVKAGRQIDVVVSAGSEQVKVPAITGVTVKEATTRLANKGLNLGSTQEVYDDKYDAGIVISQNPLADATVGAGTKVDIMVSKGKEPNKVTMPDLKGISLTDATKKLQDNKLVLGQVTRQDSTNYSKDQVSAQDTAPGVMVDEGTTVNLVLSNGPGPTTKTKRLQFDLPDDKQYYNVVITVTDAQNQRTVYNVMHRAGENINVGITYVGTGTAQVSLNGTLYKTFSLP